MLTTKIEQCTEKMDTQIVCNALCGLQFVGDSPEVRRFIATLTLMIEQCAEKPNVDRIGLDALQSLLVSARTLALRLTPKLKQCTEKLDAQTLHALCWLRRFATSEDLRKLLHALTPKSTEQLDAQIVRRALCILHDLGDSAEVAESGRRPSGAAS